MKASLSREILSFACFQAGMVKIEHVAVKSFRKGDVPRNQLQKLLPTSEPAQGSESWRYQRWHLSEALWAKYHAHGSLLKLP